MIFQLDLECSNCRSGKHDICEDGGLSPFVVIDCNCQACRGARTNNVTRNDAGKNQSNPQSGTQINVMSETDNGALKIL